MLYIKCSILVYAMLYTYVIWWCILCYIIVINISINNLKTNNHVLITVESKCMSFIKYEIVRHSHTFVFQGVLQLFCVVLHAVNMVFTGRINFNCLFKKISMIYICSSKDSGEVQSIFQFMIRVLIEYELFVYSLVSQHKQHLIKQYKI